MPTPVRTTIGAVAQRYRQQKLADELADDWFFLVYRVFSFVLVPPLARAGVSPSAVTLTAGVIALTLPAVAWQWGWVGLAGVAFVFCVLDGVDGDLARTYGQGSPRGAWLDANVDLLYRVMVYVAVGMAAWRVSGQAVTLAPAWMLLAAALALLARLSRATAELQRMRTAASPRPHADPPAARGLAGWMYGLLASLDHALPALLVLAGLSGQLDWLVYWLVVYSACDYVVALRESWLSHTPG